MSTNTSEALHLYYSLQRTDEDTTTSDNILDIDSCSFDSKLYMQKLLKDCRLSELLDTETSLVREIRELDSHLQGLVYDNYNKFISATDTVRKMKSDFMHIENVMENLSQSMAGITTSASSIVSTLQDRRVRISELAETDALIMKLQFLFELPSKMQGAMEKNEFTQAARLFVQSRRVLQRYGHMPWLHSIASECTDMAKKVTRIIKDSFFDSECSARNLTHYVDLLLQLGEPSDFLCNEFLSQSRDKLMRDLDALQLLAKDGSSEKLTDVFLNDRGTQKPLPLKEDGEKCEMDILAFVDTGCNGFLSNLSLVVTSYSDVFLKSSDIGDAIAEEGIVDEMHKNLVLFVLDLMTRFLGIVESQLMHDLLVTDNGILLRALDRFHRRLQATVIVFPEADFSRTAVDIVVRTLQARCDFYVNVFKEHLEGSLRDLRQRLVTSRSSSPDMHALLSEVQHSLLEKIKSVLAAVQDFLLQSWTFALKPHFQSNFNEKNITAVLQSVITLIIDTCKNYVNLDKDSMAPCLLLILSRLCVDYECSTISYLFDVLDQHFFSLGSDSSTVHRSHSRVVASELIQEMQGTGSSLLQHYVYLQGASLAHMLRKSMETRDWLNTIEPRSVRAVMKRVVEDVTAMHDQIGQLFQEGARNERGSDSSRRTGFSKGLGYPRSTGFVDQNLMNNIQRLFAERVQIFAPVEFTTVSIVTGVVKLLLKALAECVRLRTFSKYGLQQVQVDCLYLQSNMWRFLSDENVMHVLLDEVLSNCFIRCIDPVWMENSVAELLCERG